MYWWIASLKAQHPPRAGKPGSLVCQTCANGWETGEGAERPAALAAPPLPAPSASRPLARAGAASPLPSPPGQRKPRADRQVRARSPSPPTAAGTGDPVRAAPFCAPRGRRAHGRGAHGPGGGRARGAVSPRMRRRRRRVGGWGGPAAPTPFIWPLRRRRQPDLGAKLCAKLRRAGGVGERQPAAALNLAPRPRPLSHARPQAALPGDRRRRRSGARLVLTSM